MRNEVRVFDLAAQRARVVERTLSLQDRGRRESRASDAPAASCAKMESTRVSHHRFAGSVRLSPRNGFNGCFVISSATGLFCHRRSADVDASDPVGPETSPQNLTPASGRQDHTTSPYATSPLVCAPSVAHESKGPPCDHDCAPTLSRPPHPAPRSWRSRAAPLGTRRPRHGCWFALKGKGNILRIRAGQEIG